MKDPYMEYKSTLAAFSQRGRRWENMPRLVYWGRAANLSAENIISDIRGAGIINRDKDIRRLWLSIAPFGDCPQSHHQKIHKTGSKLIVSHDSSGDSPQMNNLELDRLDIHCIRELSSDYGWISNRPQDATRAYLEALWREEDILYVFSQARPSRGILGVNMRTRKEWVNLLDNGGTIPGDLIVPNPFSGKAEISASGKPSLITQSTLARLPYIIVEFDSMALPYQYDLWRKMLLASPLQSKIAAIVHSGNKSLHALIETNAANLEEWLELREKLLKIFPEADPQAMRPRTATRLPGSMRSTNNKPQTLAYLR